MQIISKRAGALALATALFAGSFGAASSGAIAQDRAEAVQSDPETALIVAEQAQSAADPQVRFVASETVQDIPAEPEPAADDTQYDAESLRQLVRQVEVDDDLSREERCLAQAVYFESRGEPLDGQLAVARVIVNRAESRTFPDDYCSVVTQRSQFSFVRGGRIPAPNRASAAWERAKAIAHIAHRDLWESEAGDALYFHARYVSPSWARRMTARATIDNHIFYR